MLALAAVLALTPGPQGVLERAGAFTTFCMPFAVALAFWGAGRTPAGRSGPGVAAALTAGVLAAGVIATAVGQAIVGNSDTGSLFSNATGAAEGNLVTFPFTVPLAGLILVIMLQITLVWRKWPFAGLSPLAGGLAALATSWVLGIGAYALLVNWDVVPAAARDALGLRNPGGPVAPLDLLAFGFCVVVWQVVVFHLLDGWPVTALRSAGAYLLAANALTLGGGYLTWLALDSGLDRTPPEIIAAAAAGAAGVFITSLLFDGWPAKLSARTGGAVAALLGLATAWSVAIGYALWGLGNWTEDWTRQPVQLWAAIVALNVIGGLVLLHVRVWHRWPTPAAPEPEG